MHSRKKPNTLTGNRNTMPGALFFNGKTQDYPAGRQFITAGNYFTTAGRRLILAGTQLDLGGVQIAETGN